MKSEIMNCLTWYANKIAETVHYKSWDDHVCREEINRHTGKMIEEVKKHIDFYHLTKEEAVELRFGKWSDDSNLYLIPLWLLPAIPVGITLTCISGDKIVYDGKNIDIDTRFGCLAWGIEISD